MFLSITELQLRPLDIDLKIAPGKLDLLDGALRQESDLTVKGRASFGASTREILVEGVLSVAVSFACDRCLERVRKEIRKAFRLEYLPEDLGPVEDEREIGEADADIGFYADGGLELDDVLRELVILELPMRRVCEPDCAEDPETHLGATFTASDEERRDSRWDALNEFVAKETHAEGKPGKDASKKMG